MTQLDTPPTPPPSPTSPPPEDSSKFAGKYDTPEALEQGIVEARNKIGLAQIPDGTHIIGDMYGDVTSAEMAYKDLESIIGKISAPKPPTAAAEPADAETPLEIKEPVEGEELTVEQILSKADLDPQDLQSHWAEHGNLSDEQYAALKKQNYTKPMVDQYLRGQAAVTQMTVAAATDARQNAINLVGGENQMNNLLTQAVEMIPANQHEAFNARLKDPGQVEGAVRELMQRHSELIQSGNARPLIEGTMAHPVNTGAITTPEDYFDALGKARRGDMTARNRIASTEDPSRFT
jgi:hypothetical protein